MPGAGGIMDHQVQEKTGFRGPIPTLILLLPGKVRSSLITEMHMLSGLILMEVLELDHFHWSRVKILD